MRLEDAIGIGQAKKELKTQEQIREEKAWISGKEGSDLNNLILNSNRLLNLLEETNDGKKNKNSILKLAKKLDIRNEELEKAFVDGLHFNIKAAYRIGFLNKNSLDEDVNNIIGAYVLNFRSSLKNFTREDRKDTSENILAIAKRVYLLPPTIIKDLRAKYKDNEQIDDSTLKYFIIGYPSDPVKAIETALHSIKELKEKTKIMNILRVG